jgi:hypothetical protein
LYLKQVEKWVKNYWMELTSTHDLDSSY